MRRVLRSFVRLVAFGVLRSARFVERWGADLAEATFSKSEVNALAVAEWESFGERSPLAQNAAFVWETEFYAAQVRPDDSILVVGAGSGRDVFPLLRGGHRVVAMDITPRALGSLAETAAREGLTVETMTASIVGAHLPPRSFDVILFSWFTYGFIADQADRQASLKRCAGALRGGGRVLISYQTDREVFRPLTVSRSSLRFVARLLGARVREAGDSLNVTGQAGRPSLYFSHFFDPVAIEYEIRSAGFNIQVHAHPTIGIGLLSITPGATL